MRRVLIIVAILLSTIYGYTKPADVTVSNPWNPVGITTNPATPALIPYTWLQFYFDYNQLNELHGLYTAGTAISIPVFGPFYLGGDGLFGKNGSNSLFGGDIALGIRLLKQLSIGIAGNFRHTTVGNSSKDLKYLSIGAVFRPDRYISIGLSAINLTHPDRKDFILQGGVSIRPMGNDRLTFGLDLAGIGGLTGLDIAGYSGVKLTNGLYAVVGVDKTLMVKDTRLGATLGIRAYFGHATTYASAGLTTDQYKPMVYASAGIRGIESNNGLTEANKGVYYQVSSLNLHCSGMLNVDCGLLKFLKDMIELSHQENVSAVYISFGDCVHDFGSADQVDLVIQSLRSAHKKVFVSTAACNPKTLYAIRHSNRVFLTPGSIGQLYPGAKHLIFFKELLDSLGVKTQYAASGPFKTYGFMFTKSSPDKNQIEQANNLIQTRCKNFTEGIKAARGIDITCDSEPPPILTANLLEKQGLADGVMHNDAALKTVEESTNTTFEPYKRPVSELWGERPKIAIIPIVGDIVGGESIRIPVLGIQLSGANTIIRLIQKAQNDPDVKGVVLYVDSPGGGLEPSEAINRAIHILSQNKPVAISFGNVAASGAYWLSCASNHISGVKQTITGSIGVFILRFSMLELLKKSGITVYNVPENRRQSLMNLLSTIQPQDQDKLNRLIKDAFDLFIKRIRAGRGNNVADWAKKAGARVILGKEALKIGLIDDLQGLKGAIAWVAKKANVSDYSIIIIRKRGFFEKMKELFNPFARVIQNFGLKKALSGIIGISLNNNGVMARLPFSW